MCPCPFMLALAERGGDSPCPEGICRETERVWKRVVVAGADAGTSKAVIALLPFGR